VSLRLLGVGLVCAAIACSDEAVAPVSPPAPPAYDPPPEFCHPLHPDEVGRFTHCSKGSGLFGRWALDAAGLPAYDYLFDQHADPRAAWFNTEQADWRTHWAAFGNHRVNATFSNDGVVEVVVQDRGVEFLNKVDESQGAYGGGFSYVDDGDEVWATAFKWRPAGAETKRRFGMGYAEASTLHRGVEVARRTFAPAGSAPYVIDEVTVRNERAEPLVLRHYELFDVGRRSIEIEWIASGTPFTSYPGDARARRDERNGLFDERVEYDAESRTMVLRRSHAAGVIPPPRDAPSPTDYYPGDPFLVALSGDVSDTYTRDLTFFGGGGAARPEAVASRAPGEGTAGGMRGPALNGLGQPRLFVLRTDLDLEPGESRLLRFAFGVAPMGGAVDIAPEHRAPSADVLAAYQRDLSERLMIFATPDEPALMREMAWHAYQVEASVGEREYFEGRVVPQGSAYLYLHGADGAARDLGIFAMPLVYTDPPLARDELELYMRITHAQNRRMSYAFQGHGMLDDALGLHHAPSDLTLFFLWAMGEYIGATGDEAFLDERVPFWPKQAEPDARGWDHVVGAVRHLFDVVGTGEHGLIRIGTGDWSDGIVGEAPDRDLAIAAGESVPNTQMAVAVLPRIADIVEPRDAALAAEIRARVDAFRGALPSAWGGDFYGRAFFGDGELVRAGEVDLEAQVWALIADEFPAPGDRERTIEVVRTVLDEPSPAGATLRAGGMVWPAISGLLTEGYARTRPDLAWAHFKRNTMLAHALAYPDVWFGIWSGPDGLNGPGGDRPGGTWFSPVTPMTDYPVQNNNQHTMPLYAAIRMAGVVATAEGLRVDPRVPDRAFSLSTRLVDVAQSPGRIEVVYRPLGHTTRRVEIAAPAGEVVEGAAIDGVPVAGVAGTGSVTFTVLSDAGRPYQLVLTTRAS
jgi:hypothetical protein